MQGYVDHFFSLITSMDFIVGVLITGLIVNFIYDVVVKRYWQKYEGKRKKWDQQELEAMNVYAKLCIVRPDFLPIATGKMHDHHLEVVRFETQSYASCVVALFTLGWLIWTFQPGTPSPLDQARALGESKYYVTVGAGILVMVCGAYTFAASLFSRSALANYIFWRNVLQVAGDLFFQEDNQVGDQLPPKSQRAPTVG